MGLVLDQPDFLNACVRIETELGPRGAARCLQGGGARGRARPRRSARHGPRVIDVDVLLLGDLEYSSARLTLPHPEVSITAVRARAAAGARPRADAADGRAAGRQAGGAGTRAGGTPRRACAGVIGAMLLVVDVGNTQTHFGVYRDGDGRGRRALALCHRPRLDPGRARGGASPACWGCAASASPTSTGRSCPRRCLSSRRSGRRWPASTWATRCWWSVRTIRTGMPIRIDNPREVGADRLVNAVAAYERVHDTCVVVDFGTAITYDVVSAAGEYLGGIITPGRRDLDRRALRACRQAAQGGARPAAGADRQVDRRGDPQRDRVRVRRSGRRDRAPAAGRAGTRTTVIATGGLAQVLVPAVRETIDEVDDLLTLTGPAADLGAQRA